MYTRFAALALSVTLIGPSVFMAWPTQALGAITIPKVEVGTLAVGAAETQICNVGGWLKGLLSEFIPFLRPEAVGVALTASVAGTTEEVTAEAAQLAGQAALLKAQLVTNVPVNDPLNALQNLFTNKRLLSITLNTNTTAQTTTGTYKEVGSNTFRECVLDPLIHMVKQMIIDAITQSTIAWIQGGFQGAPAFITNPGKSFTDVGKAAVSSFLYESGMDEVLCEPWRVEVILGFLWGYETPEYSEFGTLSCSLDEILTEGVYITVNPGDSPDSMGWSDRQRAFEQGGFSRAGFVGFFQTINKSKIDTAYQVNASALSKAAQAKATEGGLLKEGQGWLSQRCDSDGDGKKDEICTPGGYISSQVNDVMGSALTDLGVADEFGEILDALLKYVVTEIVENAAGDYGLLHVRSNL